MAPPSIGELKVESAKPRLLDINPDIEVVSLQRAVYV